MLGHFDLGTRFHFADPARSWVPYLEAALTRRQVTVTNGVINAKAQAEDVTIAGRALTLGGGIRFYFNENWAAHIQLALSGGRFTDVEVGDLTYTGADFHASTARFNVGASWWP